MSDVSSSSKRPADDVDGGTTTKKSKNMVLPGTGDAGGSDADTGNPSAENAVIPSPIGHNGEYTAVFRKHHVLLSYRLAWKIMGLANSNRVNFTTTSLMELPVDRPYFYMSPSEFKTLPRNAYVKNLKCKVVMRNPRTAFETNTSATSLATLNQNKFACFGVGLHQKTGGVSRVLNFASNTKTMEPQGTEALTDTFRRNHIDNMYGTHDDDINVGTGFTNIPHSFLGLPFHMNSYFCLVRDNTYKDCGWPQLANHMTKTDASFLIGKSVINYSYKPHLGMVTQPHDMVNTRWLTDADKNPTYDAFQFGQFCMDTPHTASTLTLNHHTGHCVQQFHKICDMESKYWNLICNDGPYYAPIEKCQYIKKGIDSQYKMAIQPSVHVGVYPVPRLTTTDLTDVPQEFTDVQCQWDVDVEIEIGWTMPHHTMSFKNLHLPAEDAYYTHIYDSDVMASKPCFQDTRSTFRGGYTSLVKKQQ